MRGVFVLTIVGFISAVLLVLVNNFTAQPIADAKEKAKISALQEIFPFEFSLKDVEEKKQEDFSFFEISKDGTLNAVAVETFTEQGYSGRIDVLLGVDTGCKVYGYKVLSHAETPGLGDKITTADFKNQFRDKTLAADWRVKKDGGFVDAITAATISSRAITEAVKNGLQKISNKYGCEI